MAAYRGFSPFDKDGNRTYLTNSERRAFIKTAKTSEPAVMTFCLVLAYTGARISEVLALRPQSIDNSAQCVVIECLKKRADGVYRAVPVPKKLLSILKSVHALEPVEEEVKDDRLWPWCRTTAWNQVAQVMAQAGLSGTRANSRGLRHTFAVSAIQAGVALNMVQKWMGHADIATTSLYANATGNEELAIARRMWRD